MNLRFQNGILLITNYYKILKPIQVDFPLKFNNEYNETKAQTASRIINGL